MGDLALGLDPNPFSLTAPFISAAQTAGSSVPVPTASSFRVPAAHQRGPWVDLGAQEASRQARPPGGDLLREAGRDLLRGGKEEEPGVRETPTWAIPSPSQRCCFP